MSVAAAGEGLLFAGDPLRRLEASVGVIRRGEPEFMRRALLVVAVGWLPLALLTALHGDFISSDTGNAFLFDFGVHARFLSFAASPGGWWASFVSLPLLLVLLLGWLWRICVRTRFLWLMNRLPLQLHPAPPDHAGGLGFLGSCLEGFIPIGFTVGVIAL